MTQQDNPVTIKPQATSHKPQATSHSHNTVLVSIIIPAYNTAPYIHRAIESSLRQTHSSVEVLVIDDGSTDDTLEVARPFAEKDSRVRVYHQENKGVSAARNCGIREAKGEYLVFLDSDDWLEDDAVETLLEESGKHPGRLISANVYFVGADDFSRRKANTDKVSSRFLSTLEVVDNFTASCVDGIADGIAGFNSACGKIFRLSVISQHHLRFMEGMFLGEDTLFTFMYLNRTEGAFYVSKPVLNIFLRPGSATRSGRYNTNSMHSSVKVHDEMIEYPANSQEVKYALETVKSFDLHYPLIGACIFRAAPDEIRYIRRQITHRSECLRRMKKLERKLLFLLALYMPVCLAREIFPLLYRLKKTIKPSQHKN